MVESQRGCMLCRVLLSFLTLVAAACGSSAGMPDAPAASPLPTGPDGPPVLTITPSGVNPQVLHAFSRAQTITFVNEDAVAHDMRSDAHPAHTACTQVNVGLMMPGESRQIAGPTMPSFTLCYFHDENDPTNGRFRGAIVTH